MRWCYVDFVFSVSSSHTFVFAVMEHPLHTAMADMCATLRSAMVGASPSAAGDDQRHRGSAALGVVVGHDRSGNEANLEQRVFVQKNSRI